MHLQAALELASDPPLRDKQIKVAKLYQPDHNSNNSHSFISNNIGSVRNGSTPSHKSLPQNTINLENYNKGRDASFVLGRRPYSSLSMTSKMYNADFGSSGVELIDQEINELNKSLERVERDLGL
jgi:hypothetical protein